MDDATTATFVLQCFWQDDDHKQRETGAMFYRVLRTPFKSAKKGIKLVNSPWEGAAPTKYVRHHGRSPSTSSDVPSRDGQPFSSSLDLTTLRPSSRLDRRCRRLAHVRFASFPPFTTTTTTTSGTRFAWASDSASLSA